MRIRFWFVHSLDIIRGWMYTKRMGMKLTTRNYSKVAEKVRIQRDNEIRRLYQQYKDFPASGHTVMALADKYHISKQRVSQIINSPMEPEPDLELEGED